MKQVVLNRRTLIPRIEHAKGVGKPRAQWLIDAHADAMRQAELNHLISNTHIIETMSTTWQPNGGSIRLTTPAHVCYKCSPH